MKTTKKILKQMGLTDYEIKTYLALLSLITAKAGEISEESNVPRSKIYSVLESLGAKGFIKIKKTHPFEYEVQPPQETFENFKNQFVEEITEVQETINNIYEDNLPTFDTTVKVLDSKEKVVSKQHDLMKRTRKVILMRIGFIFPSEIESIKKNILFLLKEGVTVKIIAARKCNVNNEVISIEKIFEDIPVEVKYRNIPTAQLIIRDYSEMMLVFTENVGKSVSEKNTIGLLNTYSTIISNYVLAFNKHWYKRS